MNAYQPCTDDMAFILARVLQGPAQLQALPAFAEIDAARRRQCHFLPGSETTSTLTLAGRVVAAAAPAPAPAAPATPSADAKVVGEDEADADAEAET